MSKMQFVSRGLVLLTAALLVACTPEVGSKRWCEQLKEKPKGDWSANEAADYAKHCLFSGGEGE